MSQLSGGCNQPVKEVGFSRVMGEVNNEYDQLADRVGLLINRVDKFMLNDIPENTKECCEKEALPLALQEIRSVALRMANLRGIVNNALARLEV